VDPTRPAPTRWLKALVAWAGVGPLAWLVWGAVTDGLGANPAEALIRSTGEWSLRFLCLTLAVTPLRRWTGWQALAPLRRVLGLHTFFYAALHFMCYGWLDMGMDLGAIVTDVIRRPFILVGTLALLALVPLAATSFNRAIRTLGARRWQRLHRTVYAIAGLALLHFFWMRAGKNDFAEVAVYAAVLGVLLGWRAFLALRPLAAAPPGRTGRSGKATSGKPSGNG
jgi:sulfoxide reductase heme-binding subunit YedZ